MSIYRLRTIAVVVVTVGGLAACGDDTTGGSPGTLDSGMMDATSPKVDSGSDGAVDATADAGSDAGSALDASDAGHDAMFDAQVDAGGADAADAAHFDAGEIDAADAGRLDAAIDAAADGGHPDAAIDAGTDAATNDGGGGGLNQSTVTATLYNPDLQTVLGGPATAVVGASTPTFPNGTVVGNTAFQINVTSTQITYNPLANVTYGSGTFNGFVFVFANAPTIVGVTLDAASNFTPTALSFTGNSVSMNLSGDTVATDSVAILDVQLAP